MRIFNTSSISRYYLLPIIAAYEYLSHNCDMGLFEIFNIYENTYINIEYFTDPYIIIVG